MTDDILYEKKGPVAYVTLNRPEKKNAITIDMHHRLCEIWTDFRDDPELRVALLRSSSDFFCAGADLETHAPEWQNVGPMVGRNRIDDGLCGITRGPLARFYKPIVVAIDGWCVGHAVELVMACDIRIATDRAQFGTFEIRRGMHCADGGIVNMLNTCGVGPTLEMLLTGEAFDAQKAYNVNMVSQVVAPEDLEATAEKVVAPILRCDQAAIESAKETVFECIGRPYYDQLRVEAMWGYALCGGSENFRQLREQFLNREDKGRVGTTENPL